MNRVGVIVAAIGAAVVLSFAGGLLWHDRVATVLPVSLPFTDAPPAWMSDYAKAFCGGDTAAVASRLDDRIGSEDDVKAAFARREWKCDAVRYLGSSSGRQGTAYIFVLHDPGTGLYNWWVFTATGQKIVRID